MKPLRVMLIDQIPGRSAILEQALRDAGHQVIARLSAGEDILTRVQDVEPDVILIDVESPDRDTLERLRLLTRDRPKPVILFAERSDSQTTRAAIQAGVSAYIVDGLEAKRLKPILEVAITRFREFQALRQELDATRTQLAERKIIDKAKGMLMQRKGLSEEQAYRTLRSLAMNRGQRLAEAASSVIAVIEVLNGS